MSVSFPAGYRVVVVGAGSGIGRTAARYLAATGVAVAVLDLDEAAARKTAEGAPDIVMATRPDVTDPASTASAMASAREALGGLDGVVNCAGITGRTNLKTHEVDLADFERVYRVNLLGALILSQAVLPAMIEAGFGRLLHVASIAGKEGNAGMAAYSATKAGLIGLVKVMGKDYAETGVTINALAPAVIQTPMVDVMPEQQVRYMTDRIPMKRTGTLDEAAEMIAWIISPAASFTTGFTFDLSGGRAVY